MSEMVWIIIGYGVLAAMSVLSAVLAVTAIIRISNLRAYLDGFVEQLLKRLAYDTGILEQRVEELEQKLHELETDKKGLENAVGVLAKEALQKKEVE